MVESAAATIFLIEEDDDTRPVLRANLQRYGYRVLIALDEEDAFSRLDGNGGLRFDLILVNLVGKRPAEALEIGQRIRQYGKYDGMIPLVIMAEKYGHDLEGTDVNVAGNDWITYLQDGDQLRNLLARLLATVSNQDNP